jgi:ribosomal protein L24
MKPGERLTINVVEEKGKLLEPKEHLTKFINQCGVVARDNVSITLQEWNQPKKARVGFTFVDKRMKKDC